MMENNIPEVSRQLYSVLKEIYDNADFIQAVFVYAETEEDQQTVLDFIESGDDVDVETISVLAMDLSDAREQN